MHKIAHYLLCAGIIGLFAWISFAPEPLQVKYLHFVETCLWFILLISLIRHKDNIFGYFFKGNGWLLWVYLLFVSTSLINPAYRSMAQDYYINLLILSVPIYFIAKNDIKESNLKPILLAFIIFSFIVAIIGILEILFGRNIIYERYVNNYFYLKYISQKRMMSTLMHPNILGCYLLTSTPLAYYFYVSAISIMKRRIYFFIFVTILISVLLTFSRGTWLAGLFAISVYLFFRNRKKALFLTLVAFFMFTILATFIPIRNLQYRFSLPELVKQIPSYHRIMQYSVTVNMLKGRPFTGIGLNNYRKVFDRYSLYKLYDEIKIPDSIYLMHLAETGIIGFSGFLIFLLVILKKSFLIIKESHTNNSMLLFIFLGFLAILFNMAFFDGFLWHTPFYLFWFFAGILSYLNAEK